VNTAEYYSQNEVIQRAFTLKRGNLVADYGLVERPALIWQCMPAEPLIVELDSGPVREVLEHGAEPISDFGWWHAFSSGQRPARVFEGLASSATADGWVTEVHADGHFLAGVWSFPELATTTDAPSPAVADFYTDAFRDFGYVATKLYDSIAYPGELLVTCTMLRSNLLPLAGRVGQVVAPAVKRSELRWPVITVQGSQAMTTACTAMAAQFMRAYGRAVPTN
jgi:hypothetical protein